MVTGVVAADSEESDDNEELLSKLNFIPTSWWYQCQICKVCIEDRQKFITHKLTKHPPPSTDSENSDSPKVVPLDEAQTQKDIPIIDLSDSSDGHEDVDVLNVSTVAQLPDSSTSTARRNSSSSQSSAYSDKTVLCSSYKSARRRSRSGSDSVKSISTDVPSETLSAENSVGENCGRIKRRKSPSGENSGLPPLKKAVWKIRPDKPPVQVKLERIEQRDAALSEAEALELETDIVPEELCKTLPLPSSQNEPSSTSAPMAMASEFSESEDNDEGQEVSSSSSAVTRYTCAVCQMKFAYRAQLNCHLSVAHLSVKKDANGRKILKCGLCYELYTSRRLLADHTWLHTKEQRYKCAKCMKGFIFKKEHQEHLKTCQASINN